MRSAMFVGDYFVGISVQDEIETVGHTRILCNTAGIR